MKKRGQKPKSQLYSHIASAIIPSVGIVAVPSVARYFPQQKIRANEEWGPLASTLLRASSTGQLLIPSSTIISSQRDDTYERSIQKTIMGRMDASTDEEESDDDKEQRKHRQTTQMSAMKDAKSRSASLSDVEKRLFSHVVDDDESTSTTTNAGFYSTNNLNPRQALTTELSQSTDEKTPKRTTVSITRQKSPPLIVNPVQSHSGPTSGRIALGAEGIGIEGKSTTTRSSINDSTTIPVSARSVSFKEAIVHENYDSPSSKSTVLAANQNSVLNKLVVPLSDEYEQNLKDLEQRNKLLNDEVQQVRLNNRNLEKQYEKLLDRLQTSQKLSQQELNDLLRQSGRDQTKDLNDLNQTLQNRCDQLQNELIAMTDRYTQSQNQLNLREIKNENHFLKDYIHRLNAALSEYQTTDPPKSLKKQINKEQRKMQGLPLKGPSPIWLLNQKFLAPLFVCYDENLYEKDEFIKKLRSQLNEFYDQMETIKDENIKLHERLSRSSISTTHDTHLSDIEHIKRQAYLVLEENKVLQDQLNLQTNHLTDVQKTQIQEVSNLTRRLLIIENEKTESDRILETIRMKNDDLKRKYEQLMMENNHRIHIQEHIQEISEMKRLTDELSEKHAHELQVLLRRVQNAESEKKLSQSKLIEYRSDIERLKGEIKAMKKSNKKLQLRTQIFEKKLQLQQVKEERIKSLYETTNDEFEQIKIERDTYLALAKTKEEEMTQTQAKFINQNEKITHLEELLENYKNKTKDRLNEAQEGIKKQNDHLKLRCLEHEQRIQQLVTLLNEKQTFIDDLYAEKQKLETDLETIWQTTNADNIHIREQLLDMRFIS